MDTMFTPNEWVSSSGPMTSLSTSSPSTSPPQSSTSTSPSPNHISWPTSSSPKASSVPSSSLNPSLSLSMRRIMILLITITSMVVTTEGITVQEVRFLSDSGKSDYALVGEGITFSCLYSLDVGEEIQSIVWQKDKEDIYVLDKDQGNEIPVAMGPLKEHVLLRLDSPSSLVLRNASIHMQGDYTCHVTTQRSRSQNEGYLIVILDSCKESSWETHSDMVSCVEDITFYCRGMFPKPSPVCGIYNDMTGSYVQSVPFDRVERMEDGTFEISLFRRLHAKDWIKHPGQLSFRCFIIVMSTTWRKGIHHRLFGDSGCVAPPPVVKGGYYNMTHENTCWQTPREGSRVTYSCGDGLTLLGPEQMVCRNGSWKGVPSPRKIHLLDTTITTNTNGNHHLNNNNSSTSTPTSGRNQLFSRRLVPRGPQLTVCNSGSSSICTTIHFLLVVVTMVSMIFFKGNW